MGKGLSKSDAELAIEAEAKLMTAGEATRHCDSCKRAIQKWIWNNPNWRAHLCPIGRAYYRVDDGNPRR